MKRIIAFLVAVMMVLTGCTQPIAQTQPTTTSETIGIVADPTQATDIGETTAPTIDESSFEDEELNFAGLNDPTLLQYTEDSVYANLVAEFDSEDYVIESVSAVYISEEYLEELAYNSKTNVYFGRA